MMLLILLLSTDSWINRFSLDIAGGSTRTPEEVELENYVLNCEQNMILLNSWKGFYDWRYRFLLSTSAYDFNAFPFRFVLNVLQDHNDVIAGAKFIFYI